MKKLRSILLLCFGSSAMVTAQTKPLPYFTGFEDLMPVTDWQAFRKGPAADPHYLWTINNTTPYAGTLSLSHTYPVGGTAVTDDWYVSPAFLLTDGGKIDSIRHMFSGFGTPMAGDTVAIYLLKGNADPALATSKTLLYDFRDAKYSADYSWNKTSNITIPPTTGNTYIAIRYHTVNNWLDVRFDNIGVSGNKPSSIAGVYKQGVDFIVFPLPVVNTLNISAAIPFKRLELYDATGRLLNSQAFEPRIDLSACPSGMYKLLLYDAEQKKGAISITKQ